MNLEQHAGIAPRENRRENPNFSTKLMFENLFGEKHAYVDDADLIH